MGLNERRKIKELQDTTLPGRVKEIEEICGKPIPYEVDWESLADDAEGLNFFDNISCHRLNMALRVICQDDMGKEALAAFDATKVKEPNRFRGYAGAAKAAEKLGDRDTARANYEKLVALVGQTKSDRPEIKAAYQFLGKS